MDTNIIIASPITIILYVVFALGGQLWVAWFSRQMEIAETNPEMASTRVKSLLKAGRNAVILTVVIPIFLILIVGVVLAGIALLSNEDPLRYIVALLFAARATLLGLSVAYPGQEDWFTSLARLPLGLNLIVGAIWFQSSEEFPMAIRVISIMFIPIGILFTIISLRELFGTGKQLKDNTRKIHKKARRSGYRKARRLNKKRL